MQFKEDDFFFFVTAFFVLPCIVSGHLRALDFSFRDFRFESARCGFQQCFRAGSSFLF